MNPVWNRKNLERPANNIWTTSTNEIELAKFLTTLNTVIKDLQCQDALHMEAAILSRLIYRMKSKFRNDKGLKNMEKVNRALLNYLELELSKEYKTLATYIEIDADYIHLPTKQMLEYVLVRTQGFAKLMCRVENVAKYAGEFFKARLHTGHAWVMSVIAYAVISRIWFLSRCLLKRCCSWYKTMYQYLNKFVYVGPPWLPSDCQLPENLKTWLDLPWIDQVTDSVPLADDGKGTIFNLIKAQSSDLDDSNIDEIEILDSTIPNTSSSDIIQDMLKKDDSTVMDNKKLTTTCESLSVVEDLGTSIDRNAFDITLLDGVEPETNAKKKKQKKKLKKQKETDLNLEQKTMQSELSVTKDDNNSTKTNLLSQTLRKIRIKKQTQRKTMQSEKPDHEGVTNSIDKQHACQKAKLKKLKKKLSKTPSTNDLSIQPIAQTEKTPKANTSSLSQSESSVKPAENKTRKRKKLSKTPSTNDLSIQPIARTEKTPKASTSSLSQSESSVKPAENKTRKRKKLSSENRSVTSTPKKKSKQSVPIDLKSKNDVRKFLKANPYPSLDKLQWNMLSNSIRKYHRKLKKCDPSDKKTEMLLLRKINQKIEVWIT